MSLYTIADLHLSIGVGQDKAMDVFGSRWHGYVQKLEKNWRAIVEDEDSVVIKKLQILYRLAIPKLATNEKMKPIVVAISLALKGYGVEVK